MSNGLLKIMLTAVIFCMATKTVRPQGAVVKDFVTVGEGFTSLIRTTGINAAYRVFSTPTFSKVCSESVRPFGLASPNGTVTLHVGEWFPLRRLVVVGEDKMGHVLSPSPITVELEGKEPPLLNLRTDMISDGRGLLPIRTGKFRFRARTICEGASAEIFIRAVVGP